MSITASRNVLHVRTLIFFLFYNPWEKRHLSAPQSALSLPVRPEKRQQRLQRQITDNTCIYSLCLRCRHKCALYVFPSLPPCLNCIRNLTFPPFYLWSFSLLFPSLAPTSNFRTRRPFKSAERKEVILAEQRDCNCCWNEGLASVDLQSKEIIIDEK